MMKNVIALTLVALLAACAAPLTPPTGPVPTTVAAADVKVGEFWEYAVRDAYTGLPFGILRYQVVHSDPQHVAVEVRRNSALVDTYIYSPGWNPREMPITNVQRLKFQTPLPAFPFPLEPGKTWNNVVKALDPNNGRTYNVHVQGKVLGWDHVRVPAGEFDALKIRRYVFAGNAESFKSQEEIIQYEWYAPSVRRVVKEEGTSRHTDYSRSEGHGAEGMPLVVRGDWLIADLVGYSR